MSFSLPLPATKSCSACERELPLDAFGRHRYGRHGRRSVCRECRRGRRRMAPTREVVLPDGMRRCSGCGEVQPEDGFRRDTAAASGRRSRCKVCDRAGRKKALKRRRAAREREAEATLDRGSKVCRGCDQELPLASFWRRVDSPDGFGQTCIACQQEAREAPDPEDAERVARWEQRELEFKRRLRDAGVVADG